MREFDFQAGQAPVSAAVFTLVVLCSVVMSVLLAVVIAASIFTSQKFTSACDGAGIHICGKDGLPALLRKATGDVPG